MTAQIPAYRSRVQAMHNQAVFEVPDFLDEVLQAAGAQVVKPTV